MAGCCSRQGYDEFFTEKLARRDAQSYRRRGLDANARRIVGFAARHGVQGATVLDVGGGNGTLGLELLKAGAERVITTELSSSYDETAADLARAAGVEDRIERRVLDFADAAAELPDADVVVMHRVVCCYPDYERLLGAAADHSRRLLVFSYPPRNGLSRLMLGSQNVLFRLRRKEFRTFAHPPVRMLAVLEERGFVRTYDHHPVVWQIAGLERRVAS